MVAIVTRLTLHLVQLLGLRSGRTAESGTFSTNRVRSVQILTRVFVSLEKIGKESCQLGRNVHGVGAESITSPHGLRA